ncbi:alpha/beta fold hydrolase [Bacillus sp. KH172YL63]|uniref:alpha/beta fold hydrolase n=1 Tax=Bacillus sp. KH172YL63 TaxID=2709784 RepID=UPI0013E414C7|nr:alpha/beta hydrolase [Bacillus sp. KH172YL63]BCB05162.1 alpha/beta hydrolase [Bacillus sp. KH172YL63]
MILHTETFGEGEPIVFLHTGLQSGLTDFEYQRDHFKKDFKVLVPDLRGHGKSSENDFSNYFEDCASDLAETLNDFDLKKVHIVGCSLGALVGLKFAKMFPEKTLTLTLSGVISEKPGNWDEMNNLQAEQLRAFLKDEQAVQYFDHLHSSDWRQFISMGEDADWYPFHETTDIRDLSAPTLLMVGEGNEYETAGAQIYPKMNKRVHVSVIPFASHLVHAEQPEIYTKILEQFILKNLETTKI